MKPVLFELGGLEIQSYGVSKAMAMLVAGWPRELVRRGRDSEPAFTLAIAGLGLRRRAAVSTTG